MRTFNPPKITQRSYTRAGVVSLGLLELSKSVVFDTPFPDEISDRYVVVTSIEILGASTVITITSRSKLGFTMGLSSGILGNVAYLAIAVDRPT